MPPQHKRKTSKAPPIDKLIKPAIGIGLALLAYQFFKGLDSEVRKHGSVVYNVHTYCILTLH
jgi:hypothetical protein